MEAVQIDHPGCSNLISCVVLSYIDFIVPFEQVFGRVRLVLITGQPAGFVCSPQRAAEHQGEPATSERTAQLDSLPSLKVPSSPCNRLLLSCYTDTPTHRTPNAISLHHSTSIVTVALAPRAL